jgi:hypothetical protein
MGEGKEGTSSLEMTNHIITPTSPAVKWSTGVQVLFLEGLENQTNPCPERKLIDFAIAKNNLA